MNLKQNVSNITNCSDSRHLHLEIASAVPGYGVTMFSLYVLPIIIFLGVTGNVFTLIILYQAAKKVSSHCYLWWMAVFDIISLLSYIPTFWAMSLLRPYYHYQYGSHYSATWVEYGLLRPYICEIRLFFTYTVRTCSIYTIILVTVERFIMIVLPFKHAREWTISSAKMSLIIMTLLSIGFSLPWFFAYNHVPKPCFPTAVCEKNHISIVNKMIEFVILSFIPCLVIVICNSSIIYVLRSRLKINLLVDTTRAKKQEREITIRLLAISFGFCFLTLPSLVTVSIQTVQQLSNTSSKSSTVQADLYSLSIILFAINLALNFIIYCLTGVNYRSAALSLLKCNFTDFKKFQSLFLPKSGGMVSDIDGESGMSGSSVRPKQKLLKSSF